MKISGHTKAYAVLGHPVAHTLSPAMHNAAFEALGMDAVYLAFDVAPERLAEALGAMRDMGFGGANLTVPLKEIALPHLARLDESAQLLGAVNTVRFDPDGTTGFNTDGEGFLQAFEEAFDTTVAGKSVFVMGAGGAGRAVALACAGAGVTAITLCDLDEARAGKLATELETKYFIEDVHVAVRGEVIARLRKADVIVHATPLGMNRENLSPVAPSGFSKGQLAFDLVYVSPETRFVRDARAAGLKAVNGLGMLLHQGAKAFEIWTGAKAPVEVMRKALEKEVYET